MHEIEDQTKFYNSKAEKTGWRDFIRPDFINPPSCQAAQLPNFRNRKAIAFTMAEILISLTIIGIIAAITLPSLKANINEKTWATQRKALYSRLSQAIAMMPSLNGYGVSSDANGSIIYNTPAQTFINDGLSKVLKINNICAYNELSKCGIVSKYKNLGGSVNSFPTTLAQLHTKLYGNRSESHTTVATAHYSYSLPGLNAAAFETANGESVAVFYQPFCINDLSMPSNVRQYIPIAPLMCANFIYDLNGKRGPNKVGKDIGFITAFYPTDGNVVMPEPLNKDSKDENGNAQTSYAKALSACRLEGNDVRLPNREEFASMAINANLLGLQILVNQSDSFYAATNNWKMSMYNIFFSNMNYGNNIRIRCIKR